MSLNFNNPSSSENLLQVIQNDNFIGSFEIYEKVARFVELPYGLLAESRYIDAINAVFAYENFVQQRLGEDTVFRNVGTITDGRVWIDTSKKTNNTYENFLNQKINENHNTRPSFLEAIYEGSGFEIKQSSSTNSNQARRTIRIGSSKTLPYGVLGSSLESK
jgi:hypothetical protein